MVALTADFMGLSVEYFRIKEWFIWVDLEM
jgi:hypothetical protein